MSLPSRERGLKSIDEDESHALNKSLPSRERGLKCVKIAELGIKAAVAPLAGAWIEMMLSGKKTYTRASLPSRERGLKFPDLKIKQSNH